MILQGRVQGGRWKGRQKKRWEDNNIRMDRIRDVWSPSQGWGQRGVEKSGCPIILEAPTVIHTTGWVSVSEWECVRQATRTRNRCGAPGRVKIKNLVRCFTVLWGRGSSIGRARDSWWGGPGFDLRCDRPLPTGWVGVSIMWPAEAEVMVSQLCFVCGSSLGTRPRYNLVVDEDVKKRKKKNHGTPQSWP